MTTAGKLESHYPQFSEKNSPWVCISVNLEAFFAHCGERPNNVRMSKHFIQRCIWRMLEDFMNHYMS